MSESTARAERRALRRAMGPHVHAFTNDTTQAIRLLQASVESLQRELDNERYARGELVRWVGRIDGTLAPLTAGLLGRLRWILKGRVHG